MRESNFSFTSQGRSAVCITSQLYDRRALDTTSALPLTNSLNHLAYLTSTSPRIREILTVDGGLECLVRLLLDFCNSPPPPINPRHFYGLLPPGQAIKRKPLIPGRWQPFDRAAAGRFSLAFKCVVNVGVRGSENIRSRVVQAGMLSVVGSVLEQWLLSKGFAVVPSSTGSGAPRENRQTRLARRQEVERRLQQQQQQFAPIQISQAMRHQDTVTISSTTLPALAASLDAENGDVSHHNGSLTEEESEAPRPILIQRHPTTSSSVDSTHSRPSSSSSEMFSDQNSGVSTPARAVTPTTEPEVESDEQAPPRERSGTIRARPGPNQASTSRVATQSARRVSGRRAPSSRGETDMDETEADESEEGRPIAVVGALEPQTAIAVVDESRGDGMNFFGSDNLGDFDMGGVGVDRAMVNLARDDDALAMGAPPGAPGATVTAPTGTTGTTPRPGIVDVTPRAAVAALHDDYSAMEIAAALDGVEGARGARVILQNLGAAGDGERVFNLQDRQTIVAAAAAGGGNGDALVRTILAQTPELRVNGPASSRASTITGIATSPQGPFQDEDVLLSLQLLAYLSKYPYVRQAFYEPRRPLYNHSDFSGSHAQEDGLSGSGSPRSPNIFSLVERFTFRASPSEPQLPRLPQEIQYWAGVIMRNACRKDESRGGIRQCASMTCGKWETYPREFAKCRRCRKAKYCGKECQSRAWAEGHRFWCNVREAEEEGVAGAGTEADGGPRTVTVADVDAASTAVAAATAARRPTAPRALPNPTAQIVHPNGPGIAPTATPVTTGPAIGIANPPHRALHHHHHNHHVHHHNPHPQTTVAPHPLAVSVPPNRNRATIPTAPVMRLPHPPAIFPRSDSANGPTVSAVMSASLPPSFSPANVAGPSISNAGPSTTHERFAPYPIYAPDAGPSRLARRLDVPASMTEPLARTRNGTVVSAQPQSAVVGVGSIQPNLSELRLNGPIPTAGSLFAEDNLSVATGIPGVVTEPRGAGESVTRRMTPRQLAALSLTATATHMPRTLLNTVPAASANSVTSASPSPPRSAIVGTVESAEATPITSRTDGERSSSSSGSGGGRLRVFTELSSVGSGGSQASQSPSPNQFLSRSQPPSASRSITGRELFSTGVGGAVGVSPVALTPTPTATTAMASVTPTGVSMGAGPRGMMAPILGPAVRSLPMARQAPDPSHGMFTYRDARGDDVGSEDEDASLG